MHAQLRAALPSCRGATKGSAGFALQATMQGKAAGHTCTSAKGSRPTTDSAMAATCAVTPIDCRHIPCVHCRPATSGSSWLRGPACDLLKAACKASRRRAGRPLRCSAAASATELCCACGFSSWSSIGCGSLCIAHSACTYDQSIELNVSLRKLSSRMTVEIH